MVLRQKIQSKPSLTNLHISEILGRGQRRLYFYWMSGSLPTQVSNNESLVDSFRV
jgi:hypothetical protein